MTSRKFRPVGGFTDGKASHVQIDADGNSFLIYRDGTEVNHGSKRGDTAHWVPTWNVTEMGNLIAGGSWEEIQEEPKPQPVPVIPRRFTQPVHTQE